MNDWMGEWTDRMGPRPEGTSPLSQSMLLDGMYPGIVEKWAAQVAALETRIEALEKGLKEIRAIAANPVPDLEQTALSIIRKRAEATLAAKEKATTVSDEGGHSVGDDAALAAKGKP